MGRRKESPRFFRENRMKKLLAVFAVALMIVTTMPDADAAARFGGGASFGRSRGGAAAEFQPPAAGGSEERRSECGSCKACFPLEGNADGGGGCAGDRRASERVGAR